ncbi:ubiquinone/menaquinone biosynthesis C-methylase UbiE [Mucilaginibacter yixingensis]|uniref:Ubiquinone/menaquinone biosynthesis C-methylase UbiE n=1 Tax=Mucilaginibacter yixingensis TaxID=1295612 RepID=A0A2T5JEL9_9SPHI|nr:methyltransferase [Mucilaginibacter yixingensis]PTR00834.1 ubiquinone/menaquinone biosynthesis C-methylase UbiE [Mucilaginibacter yixingensis]
MNLSTESENQLTPSRIMETGLAFFASKTLLTAVKLGVFTALSGNQSRSGNELQKALGLHERGVYDFLDALVSLGFLNREGLLETAKYSNAPETELFLDKNKPSYIGGFIEMANDRLYRFWADLDLALLTGKPQNEIKSTGHSMFEELYSEPARLKQFMNAMSGISTGNFVALAQKFDFSAYSSLCDVGGAAAVLAVEVAKQHSNISCISADLPQVEPIAKEYIAARGMTDRVKTANLDFFTDEFPKADVITMGMILHDWDLPNKMMLIKKAYNALPQGGAFIVVEALIDDERRENTFGLMMSLNMLIEFGVAFDYTGADFARWTKEAGFRKVEVIPLAGPSSAAVAYK